MKAKCFLVFLAILFFFMATRESHATLLIGYYDDLKVGYYVLLEQNVKRWSIIQISDTPIKRENKKQEMLFVKYNLKFVQPAFEKDHEVWELLTSSDGLYGSLCCKKSDNDLYTPCDSKFSKFASLRIFGSPSGRGYNVDTAMISKVATETNLIRAVGDRRDADILLINKFLDKIVVEPQVIDNSGYWKDGKSCDVTKKIILQEDITPNINNVQYLISLSPPTYPQSLVSPFVISDITPKEYILKYNSDGHILKPSVTVSHKNMSGLLVNGVYEDKNLAIKIKTVGIHFDIVVGYDITNKTAKFIPVNALSIYINDSVLTKQVQLNIPPMSALNQDIAFTYKDIGDDKLHKTKKYISGSITKTLAEKLNIKIGVSASYTVAEKQQTLYSVNNFVLSDLVR